jgi:hypothetical protein
MLRVVPFWCVAVRAAVVASSGWIAGRGLSWSRGWRSGAICVGALLCLIRGATAGGHWESSSARKQLARTAAKAGVRRRFAPH